jgi:hypothetical protein
MSMTTYRILTFGSKRVELDLGAIWVMFWDSKRERTNTYATTIPRSAFRKATSVGGFL